ncbi:MAG: hypothetical protein P4L46_02765 [Fimbriimonas sp.]|nr:hypothetical protein [Fimbriimonas sp.]
MNVFDYLIQQRMQVQIDQNRHESMRTDQMTVEIEARVRDLEKSTGALWSLLKAKTGWTDEELIEQMKVAEAAHAPDHCPICGRRLLVKNGVSCSWCGRRLDRKSSIVGCDEAATDE